MKIVTAAIIRDNGKILLARRAPGDKLEGFWEFPGGKVEPGESLHECLEREIFEELGVRARAREVVCETEFSYDHGCFRLIAINTELLGKQLNPTSHDSIIWTEVTKLLLFNLLPADIEIAKYLQQLN
mgnify:CR=1 FL=1